MGEGKVGRKEEGVGVTYREKDRQTSRQSMRERGKEEEGKGEEGKGERERVEGGREGERIIHSIKA